jgi:hypothetical protein
MPIRIEGGDAADWLALQVDSTGRRAVKKLVEAAQRVQIIARKMAPREYGNLEAAIKVDPENYTGLPNRDILGRFARIEVTVYVDGSVEGDHGPVERYAYLQHEHLAPYGEWQLGPASQQKQAENPDVQVGGGYMERAGQQVEDGLDAEFQDL